MGVTCVYSPGEAEQLCAVLNKNGVRLVVNYVLINSLITL